jgi:hypothetical protein
VLHSGGQCGKYRSSNLFFFTMVTMVNQVRLGLFSFSKESSGSDKCSNLNFGISNVGNVKI